MSGLYNALAGVNNQTELIFKLSKLEDLEVGRFRDVWLDGERKVTCVYTRLGGGNRECYCDSDEHYCYEATIAGMQSHERYVTDYDDDFDCTYATFEYSWPAETADALADLATLQGPPVSGDERWRRIFAALGM